MKENKTNSFHWNHLDELSCFDQIQAKFKNSIFATVYILLKNQNTSLIVEMVFILLQLLQILAFPFPPTVSKIMLTC